MDKPLPLHKYRFWIEREDGTLEYKYKLTRLAAVRAYKKQCRASDVGIRTYGWETFERHTGFFGRYAWLDVDSIVPMR